MRLDKKIIRESFLFHGTPPQYIESICANNFDRSFGQTEYYGHGVYLGAFFVFVGIDGKTRRLSDPELSQEHVISLRSVDVVNDFLQNSKIFHGQRSGLNFFR